MGRGRFCVIVFIFLTVVTLQPLAVVAQVVLFSQPQETPLLLNPSLVGSADQRRLNFIFRNQWMHIKSPYNSYGFTFDGSFGSFNSHSMGISAINDAQGKNVIQHTEVAIYYAYMWDVTYRFRLRLGFSAGMTLKSVNYKGLVFPDMLGAAPGDYASTDYNNKMRVAPDFAVGVSGDVDSWYFGAAVHHIAEPVFDVRKESYLRLPRKYTIHAYKEFNTNEGYRFKTPLYITPRLVLTYQDELLLLAAGVSIEYRGLKATLWARESLLYPSHNICGAFGWEGNRFGIFYAYNMSILPHGFWGLNSSIHELGMVVKFDYGNKRSGYSFPYKKKRSKYTKYSRKRTAVHRTRKARSKRRR